MDGRTLHTVSLIIYSQRTYIHAHIHPSVRTYGRTDGRTDRQTDRQLNCWITEFYARSLLLAPLALQLKSHSAP